MSQATATLSRRSLFAGAATVSATALVPAIALASADLEIFKCEQVLLQIFARWEAAESAQTRADAAFAKWEKRNPEPKFDYMEWRGKPWTVEDQRAFSANRKRWRARREAARGKSGCDEAKETWRRINRELNATTDKFSDLKPATFEGLRCKARVAEAMQGTLMDEQIAWSIVEDILALQSV